MDWPLVIPLLSVAGALALILVHRLTRRRALPRRARVAVVFIARRERSGEVHLDLTTDHGPVALDLSPYLAATLARELAGADPRRTH